MKSLKDLNYFEKLTVSNSSVLSDDFIEELAISLWRMEKSLLAESGSNDLIEDSRTWKTLQRLLIRLQDKGLLISDHTGQIYDEGMALRVISSEERPDLNRNLIVETITPSVFLRGNLIHAGEVIVGKPIK